jgi:hypothetical protein
MVIEYCRKRITPVLPPGDIQSLQAYFLASLRGNVSPPRRGGDYHWADIAAACSVALDALLRAKGEVTPLLDALTRSTSSRPRTTTTAADVMEASPAEPAGEAAAITHAVPSRAPRRYAKRPVVEFPEPMWTEWDDPASFKDALALHMKRHRDTVRHLHKAVVADNGITNQRTLLSWCNGQKAPRSVHSLAVLHRIEQRYRLPRDYFASKLPQQGRASTGHDLDEFSHAERRRLAWHLPDDFNLRPAEEQEEILGWVRKVIIAGSTDYRAFQAAAIKNKYAVRFRAFQSAGARRRNADRADDIDDVDDDLRSAVVDAPPELQDEMAALLRFKTSTLTAFGYQRNGVWNGETASQKVEHLGLLFGALASSPRSEARGHGVPRHSLCFAMLVFPSVWDWYLQWRERRRGFYTKWEVDMLSVLCAIVRAETGWLRQTPSAALRLVPVAGLISPDEVAAAQADWGSVCDRMFKHGRTRIKEIQRVARVHRDPFEPILPVLEAESPVGEYRKIAEEVVRRMPSESHYPRATAEAVRSFLMLRLGLHLGLRQRNLRELRVCLPGHVPLSERQLGDMRRGELRWSDKDGGWEVLIPSVAFKNASSSFFGSRPFRVILPNLAGLYDMLAAYIDRHRARLLGQASDPGTFFVKTVKVTSASAAYNQNTFYEAWRLIIERYGIYNPYTGRGTIRGLLPHGPHNVRDVLATHILKKTGSYEQASYAIQDTPDMVAKHYGRFLPQDKSAIAALVLNRAWE